MRSLRGISFSISLDLINIRYHPKSKENRKGTTMSNVNGDKQSVQDVKEIVKGYILKEFLPGENPAELTDATSLITGGILDSLGTIKLVAFLEERFKIQIQAHETMVDYLDTISDIAQLVSSKL